MATKKNVSNRRADAHRKQALASGRDAAKQLDHKRKASLEKRERAIKAARGTAKARSVEVAPQRVRAMGPKGIATLVAEGDSWFDYFGYDVLDMLEENGYDVEEDAHAGDLIEDMAYGDNQLPKFRKLIEKLMRRGEVPKAILLSGGGNDLAGEEFALLLDHARSATPGLNEDVVRGIIDVRLRNAYLYFLSAVTETCSTVIGRKVPILVHGYAYAVPDGRGVLGGFWILPGPWLQPGFHQKGFADLMSNRGVVAKLIDRFNAMLKGVASSPDFDHVHYVDLRKALASDSGYKNWWGNELHPTKKGFKAVTKLFLDKIESL